jgi:polysaccharide biosynthesis protein PslH
MRALILSHEPPVAPYNGHRLALASLLPDLGEMHEVRVLALGASGEAAERPGLRVVTPDRGARIALRDWQRFIVHRRPRHVDVTVDALAGPLAEELERFDPDLVHVFSNRLAAAHALLDRRPRVLTALDAAHRNVAARAALARGVRRVALRTEGRAMERFIADEFPFYDAVVMVTPQDAEAVAIIAPKAQVTSIPNGVEAARYVSDVPRHPGRVVFHGAMSYAPNVDAARWAATELLPLIRSSVATAELVLVGRDPSPEVRQLAQLPGVQVTGEVDDVAPWLASAAVYLCPMRSGTGIKNKLLEAMAAGAPCVVTPLALQGIDAVNRRDVLVGADALELAAGVVDLLGDPDGADRMGMHARDLVVEQHSWSAAARAYADLYERVTSGR